jgi:hypothetical protein
VILAKAVKILLQFSASYICEQDFSCLTDIKSKDRNRLLSVEEELRTCFSKIRPKTSSNVTLKVNFTMTFYVNLILMFKFR